jgi:hypothetical protein
MRIENVRMKKFLKDNGIDCTPKYMWDGSLKGTWRLYNKDQKWTPELTAKLTSLGFVGLTHEPLHEYSGNGGMFSVFVRGHNELK